jgi:hypothetical protein
LPASEIRREQEYVARLYERVDVLRERVSAQLALALRQGGGTAQSRLERWTAIRWRPSRSACVRPPPRSPRTTPARALTMSSRKRRAVAIQMVVPAAVRVEAGWDRTSPAWVFTNRLRIADSPLDTASANTAAAIRDRTGVSVADSHLGAVIRSAPHSQITVVTSDPHDMRLVAGDKKITVTAI